MDLSAWQASPCIPLQVGPTYGRKTLTGLLASEWLIASEVRVGNAMKVVSPVYCQARRTETRKRMNPVPYVAHYFGEKVHIDQNEKLVRYGIIHICCVDGYSAKIVGFATMPVKSIYTAMKTHSFL